jgi:hypothetical protein
MTIVFSGSPVANVELADSFNTWRLTTNKILNDAASLTANNSMAGTLSVGSTFSVTGAATFSNTVAVTGNTSFANGVTIPSLTVTRGLSQVVKVIGSVTTSTNINLDDANIFDITLGANNITFTFTNPPISGFAAGATIILRQDGTGTRFATFTNAVYTDGIPPVLTTNANAIDMLSFFTTDGGTSYFGSQTMAAVS